MRISHFEALPGTRPAARTAARMARLRVETIRDRAGFDAIAEVWRALERVAPGATLFQSQAWCVAVLSHQERDAAFAPAIIVARRGDRLVGALPLQRMRHGPVTVLTGLGEPFQQYSEMLLAPDEHEAAAAMIDAALAERGIDGLHLLKVREDSALAAALAGRGTIAGNPMAAPFVDLTPFPTFADYYSGVNAKTRKNMRNARNRLARGGDLAHAVFDDRADVAALVARAHAGRERWLAEQGLTSRAFRDGSFGDFAEAVAAPDSGLDVMAMSLSLDGKPLADQWGFVFNGRYYAYVATWDPDFVEASPGKLHLEEVIRCCHERGVAVADFLMPAARYKFTWTDKAMPVADHALPTSFRGNLYFSLWSQTLRPRLKRLALAMPKELRSRVAKVVAGR